MNCRFVLSCCLDIHVYMYVYLCIYIYIFSPKTGAVARAPVPGQRDLLTDCPYCGDLNRQVGRAR